MLMLRVHDDVWCRRLFGIERSMLAEIRSSVEEYGRIAEGPLAGVPITGCLGDQQAALLGQRCCVYETKNTSSG